MQHTTDETFDTERRRHERRPFERQCKLLHAASLRYLGAETRDLSSGGALLELSQARSLAVGDRVDVMIDWEARGFVGRSTMLPATVAWVACPEGFGQRVGVSFSEELQISQAA